LGVICAVTFTNTYDLHHNFGRALTVEKFDPRLIFHNSNIGLDSQTIGLLLQIDLPVLLHDASSVEPFGLLKRDSWVSDNQSLYGHIS